MFADIQPGSTVCFASHNGRYYVGTAKRRVHGEQWELQMPDGQVTICTQSNFVSCAKRTFPRRAR